GVETPDAFLDWHHVQGGLVRSLEVLLAAVTYQRMTYEWDSSIWALRRTRPAQGLFGLGVLPWFWLRDAVADAKPGERAEARTIAARGPRSFVVRAALAFAFPDDGLWTAADDAVLRQV